METQRAVIETELANHGWTILAVDDKSLEWWADESWRLESAWSPVGALAFITFLVDPQSFTLNRKKGQDVWAVKASRVRPDGWLNGLDEFTMGLGQGWEEELPRLLQHLAELRNQQDVNANDGESR